MPLRAPINRIPKPNDNYLVDDRTLEIAWSELRKEFSVSRDLELDFLTWIVPGGMIEKRGVWVPSPEQAAFMVVSPNPVEGKDDVKTFALTPLKYYYLAVKEFGHYVSGRSHPAKTIFGHLARQHL